MALQLSKRHTHTHTHTTYILHTHTVSETSAKTLLIILIIKLTALWALRNAFLALNFEKLYMYTYIHKFA